MTTDYPKDPAMLMSWANLKLMTLMEHSLMVLKATKIKH